MYFPFVSPGLEDSEFSINLPPTLDFLYHLSLSRIAGVAPFLFIKRFFTLGFSCPFLSHTFHSPPCTCLGQAFFFADFYFVFDLGSRERFSSEMD